MISAEDMVVGWPPSTGVPVSDGAIGPCTVEPAIGGKADEATEELCTGGKVSGEALPTILGMLDEVVPQAARVSARATPAAVEGIPRICINVVPWLLRRFLRIV